MNLDRTDYHILRLLHDDARLSMRELARQVNLSPSSVSERVRKLEDTGIIRGYRADIDRSKLGCGVRCMIEVTLRNGEHERFADYIRRLPWAEFAYRVAGKACFMVMLSAPGMSEIEACITELTPYAMTVTHVVFSQVELPMLIFDPKDQPDG
ncbi:MULTISPECIES: Lrp/AsnC family transcriptional regulator [Paenibacillus]|uniref:AsnC family transcriptional regulator n=1 Tax=Paenibacillus pabuli TaxID=1472 RepID=A0A855Y3R4_9BACL|nr:MULTISPECIES: Lrp/AsnC family transcriptional regulator [Paenibacillus]PWW35115.1 AsnC family transcriptional regulator [Paenibacillus pabuli]PXW01873.1 AsnC family transcriptional regulator [Paenibacillus taichungensis]RAI91802.1 AsnC family transcriptional regulator [Paenibacillus pabuli]